MADEKIFKITETQVSEILNYLKNRSTLAVKNMLKQLEEIKDE